MQIIRLSLKKKYKLFVKLVPAQIQSQLEKESI